MTSSANTFTYWSLLGLSPGSDSDQLKQAFKREAKRWHPDLNRDNRSAEERFKWINEAYLVLSDPKKRFEWEVAGRPSIEIKEVIQKTSTRFSQEPKNKQNNVNSTFNSAEKFLILLIAFVTILFLNAFVF